MKNNNIKSVIQKTIAGKKYLSVKAIKKQVEKTHKNLKPATVNQYLFTMKTEGMLYDAGRGWYSTISEVFKPNTKTIRNLATILHTKYPLLSFAVWSTEQLQPFAHHLMTKFTRLVYTGSDSMPSVAAFLQDQGYRVLLNPRKKEVDKYFDASFNSIVVRPSVSRQPVEGHYAMVEKILIDLFIEKDRLLLMDGAEYERIFRNLLFSYRINMACLLQYAERRKFRNYIINGIVITEKKILI